MKVLLQDTKTGLYFQNPGVWIREIEAAFDFRNSESAMEYALFRKLPGVQVVVAFPGNGYIDAVSYQIAATRVRRAEGTEARRAR